MTDDPIDMGPAPEAPVRRTRGTVAPEKAPPPPQQPFTVLMEVEFSRPSQHSNKQLTPDQIAKAWIKWSNGKFWVGNDAAYEAKITRKDTDEGSTDPSETAV